MRKTILYGIAFLLLCQVVGCGQTQTTTETGSTAESSAVEAVAEENIEEVATAEEDTTASDLPEPKVNEYGDIEEHEQHKYGELTRYIIKRDGYDQTEEWLHFNEPVVVLDNSCIKVSFTDVNCTTTADGRIALGFCYDAHNKLTDRRMCVLSKDEQVAGKYIDFKYSNGSWTVSPDSTTSFMQGSDDITGKTITIDDMLTLEGKIQCDREKNGSFGSDSDDYTYSLKSALDKLN